VPLTISRHCSIEIGKIPRSPKLEIEKWKIRKSAVRKSQNLQKSFHSSDRDRATFRHRSRRTASSVARTSASMQILTADGHFMQVILRPDLPKIASNNGALATADENKAIVQGSIGFFGAYSFRDKVITFKIDASSYPNWNGTEQTRNVSAFNRNEMTWTLAAPIGSRRESTGSASNKRAQLPHSQF
jgi:hypothetical protein